ncbi:Pepco domain-containing protein [Jidongwangia harbinensis]|uniref:Pepco domain-containing protein n=1 Tax=Jidongwangia harbinensis TaxID=2878561 RepID=UPI001CD91D2D|nr:hypothetical protein [Jidongwangia harbinensis]MCA2215449.1 hypothetical protein [Jidongwangia harbinensis]
MTELSTAGAVIPIVYVDERVDGEKGLFSAAQAAATKVGAVSVGELSGNLRAMCGRLGEMFAATRELSGEFELDEFEVILELTAKGEVRLIGSASTEVKGGVKLIFRRPGAVRS